MLLRDIFILMLKHCHQAIERDNVILTGHVELYFFQILVASLYLIVLFSCVSLL